MVIPADLPALVAPVAWMLGTWEGWGMYAAPAAPGQEEPTEDSPVIEEIRGAVVGEQQRQAAYARLHAWLNDNLVPNEHAGSPDGHGGVQKALRLRNPRVITWAFIAWDK